jgi:CubicO group peptidase (beta-lactamase class C family)
MPAEEYIQTHILDKLDMDDTACNMFQDNPLRPRVSSTYRRMQNRWFKYWENTRPQAVPYFRGSGGMYSTTTDYARFLALWMDKGKSENQRLLSPETVQAALTTSALSRNNDQGYGYQWQVFSESEGVFGHGGSDGTLAMAFPRDDLMLLCFTQSRGGKTISEIRSLFLEVFLRD